MSAYYYIACAYPGGGLFTVNTNGTCSYGFNFELLAKFDTVQQAEDYRATMQQPEGWVINSMENNHEPIPQTC